MEQDTVPSLSPLAAAASSRPGLGPGDWGAFVATQRKGAVEKQRGKGLSEAWCEQIPDFLDCATLAAPARPSLLHTEFMRQHLTTDAGRLTGVFDFEPAAVGAPAYDFVAVGLFTTRAEPGLLTRFFRAYGESFAAREQMAYALLHVYSNLPWYLRELPAPPEPTFESLAETWFGAE
ncbi:phosphotransferase [Streptomyces sp. NPDC005507]|uniref:phosphotransferase n=1 Tax=Streptomyces sp. NPDC005507 TaxID=3154885 RepID=UPI0033BD3C7A